MGRGSCLRRRNPLQKGLRRAWSPWAAAPVCVAGAVLGASRKGCGAPGRRGPRLLSAWQAQFLEPPERVAARLVAVGRGSCLLDYPTTFSHCASRITIFFNDEDSSHITHRALFISHRQSKTTIRSHLALLISHHPSHTTHPILHTSHYPSTPLISQHSSYATYLTSFVSDHTYFITHCTHLLHYTSRHIIVIHPFSLHLSLNLSSHYPYYISRLYTLDICKTHHVGLSGPVISICFSKRK